MTIQHEPARPASVAATVPVARLMAPPALPLLPFRPPHTAMPETRPGLGSVPATMPVWGASRRLAGRTVVVSSTGGDAPQAIVRSLLREGAAVAVVALDAERIAADSKDAASEGATQCCAIVADAAAPAHFRDAVGRTVSLFGVVDAVVIDASGPATASLADGAISRVEAAFERMRAAVAHLRPGGSVVTTLASASYREVARLLEHTRAWALALRQRNIRVNGVAPRLVAVELDRTVCWLPSDVAAATRGLGERCVQILLDDAPGSTGHVFPAE